MWKRICFFMVMIPFVLLALLSFFFIAMRSFGFQNAIVQSRSQEAPFAHGSVAFFRHIDPAELKIGDIVAYRYGYQVYVSNPITAVDCPNMLVSAPIMLSRSMGESEQIAMIPMHDVVGRVSVAIPLVGHITMHVQTPRVVILFTAFMTLLMLIAFMPNVMGPKKVSHTQQS